MPAPKDPMAAKRADLKKKLDELAKVQKKMHDGESITTAEMESAESLVTETDALQKEIDTYDKLNKRVGDSLEAGRKLADPAVLPPDDVPDPDDDVPEEKRLDGDHRQVLDIKRMQAADGKPAVAYMRLGHFTVVQKALSDFIRRGMPKNDSFVLAQVPSLLMRKGGGEPLVPVSREMLKSAYEAKAVPTLGDGVIEPTRIPEVVRVTEHDRLQIRDVLDIQQTGSDAVKYTRIVSYSRAAATVTDGAQKPQSGGMLMDAVTEAVRTIAVWMPIQDQQVQDYPALTGIINGELLYDNDKHLEELVMYGDGTGEDFTGILNDPAVLDCRTKTGDSFIDISRRGITDVRRAGYEPNAILVDPLDWEDIVLEKGTDNRYVWVVVTDGATQRLWAVPVIETVAMEDYAGVSTEERNLLVGDFLRGATLWDRMRSQISVGWINDQFIRNQRTILAEQRAAFGVKRPGAFRKYETQAASAS